LLCSPAKSAITKALKLFEKEQSNFDRATFIIPDEHRCKQLFKKWKLLDIPSEKDIPHEEIVLVYVWQKKENTISRLQTGGNSMKFKSKVNKTPTVILMDSGASGTAFISKEKCESENIAMTPAPTRSKVIMGNNEVVMSTHMAMIQ
jgi:hypothetical protein